MEKLVKDYIKKTGAIDAELLTESAEYGKVWSIQYGAEGDDGILAPTGLPVLIHIGNGEVVVIPPDEAFALLSSLSMD